MSFVLDTLATVRKLQSAGFSEDQAEAVTNVVRQAQDAGLANLATKADVHKVEARIDMLESKVEAKIDALDRKFDAKIDALDRKFDAKIDKLDNKVEAIGVAMKADLREVESKLDSKIEMVRASGKADLRETELRLEAKIEAAKAETVRWLVMTQAGLAGFIFAVLKFLH